jgi:glutamate 5-kinase
MSSDESWVGRAKRVVVKIGSTSVTGENEGKYKLLLLLSDRELKTVEE